MYKTISNICITAVLVLLIVTLVKPDLTNKATNRILGTLIKTKVEEVSPSTAENSIEPLKPSSFISYLRVIRPAGDRQDGDQPAAVSDQTIAALSTNNIVDATNRERINAGLPPLKLNNKLVTSAKLKTDDMIEKQYFEHISPTGEGVSDLGQKVGYDYIIMGENLALGNFVDGNDVVKAWMNSAGHRANILNPNYEEIGVYAAKAMYQGREVWFAVQHFGTARDACPAISTSLKSSIDATNVDLKQRQAQIANEKAILEAPDHPQGDEFKEQVNEFNKLVAEYNTNLVISQEKIKEYNAQVSAFNACLTQYQTKK